jgi:DNA polymerase III delta prime subunit
MLKLFDEAEEDWNSDASEFCRASSQRETPPRMTARSYDTLTDAKRDAFDGERFDYMSRAIVETMTIDKLKKRLHRALIVNRRISEGRVGLIVSGPAGQGKTTALRALASWVVRRSERESPGALARGDVPAVYVSVPPPATPRSMIARLAAGIRIPVRPRDTAETLMREVVPQLRALRTKVVFIDELHRLGRGGRDQLDTSDVLKDLSDLVRCTFVYVGIGVERSGVLAGERGAQLAGRCSLLRMEPFGPNDADEWSTIVEGFVERSCLLGNVDIDADFLMERSRGSIGVLSGMFLQVVGLKLNGPHFAKDETLMNEDFEEAFVPIQADSEAVDVSAVIAHQTAITARGRGQARRRSH